MSHPTVNVIELVASRQVREQQSARSRKKLDELMSAGREILQHPHDDGLNVHKYMEYVMQHYSCSYDRIAAIITMTHDTMMPVLSPQAAELLRNLLDAVSSAL